MADTGGNMVNFEEVLVTQISGTSYQKNQLAQPEFLTCRHGWNFPGSHGAVYLPYLPLLHFIQCDPASKIIAVASSYSSEVLWVKIRIKIIATIKGSAPIFNSYTIRST